MNKGFLIGGLAVFAFFTLAQTSLASGQYGGQYGCATQYGGECPSQEISLTKTVKDPKTGTFVASLQNTDNRYSPTQVATFKISVTNIGGDTIGDLTIQDNFPDFISFTSGPGRFDSNTKTLTFDLLNLNPGETRDTIIQGKIADQDKLPSDQGITCVVNHAQATLNGKLSTSDSQLCIEKPVLPAQTKGGLTVFPSPNTSATPPTGPEALALIPLIPAMFVGIKLRRKASR